MHINKVDRCLDCMQDKSGKQVCPNCGRDEKAQRQPPYLPYGTRLNDQYVVGRALGHGGFGITYLAWDMRLDVRVAIKEYMPRDFAVRSGDSRSVTCFEGEAVEMFAYGREKFLDEARKLARFNEHPGIVSVLSFFEANATAYMVMEYIDGMDLKQHLAQVGGRLPVEVALAIMTPVLDALRAVHDAGLLHRDMSPDNVYVTSSQRIMILDFGAARDAMGSHSKSLALIRKPGYSPEEQYRAKGEQGPWTDVYAAAATLYCMLTGSAPPEALDRLTEDTLEPPSRLGVPLGPEHEAALMKALAVRAGDRFQSIRAIQDALFTGSSHPNPPPPPKDPRPGLVTRQKSPVSTARCLMLALLLLLLLGGLGWFGYGEYLKSLGVGPADDTALQETEQFWQTRLHEVEERCQEAENEAQRQTRLAADERRQREQEALARREAEQRAERADKARREAEQIWRQRLADAEAQQKRCPPSNQPPRVETPPVSVVSPIRCHSGHLSGSQIRNLVTNHTAFGTRLMDGQGFKEYQGANGTAYFQKEGASYITGRWKISGDTICWCYGGCSSYDCKRVWRDDSCTEYYIKPDSGQRTGRINRWVQGDKTN